MHAREQNTIDHIVREVIKLHGIINISSGIYKYHGKDIIYSMEIERVSSTIVEIFGEVKLNDKIYSFNFENYDLSTMIIEYA